MPYHFNRYHYLYTDVQGCGRAGRDGNPSACISILAESDVPGLRSQIFGTTPPLSALQMMSAKIFAKESFLSNCDSAVYMSYYDFAQEFDITELQLRLCMSHLVQQGHITELTSTFGQYKVGLVNEEKLQAFYKKFHFARKDTQAENDESMDAGGGDNDWMKEAWGTEVYENDPLSEMLPDTGRSQTVRTNDFLKRKAHLAMLIVDHLKEQQTAFPRRKSTTVDLIEKANELKVPPLDALAAIGLLVNEEVVTKVAVSRLYTRYKLLRGVRGKEDTEEIAQSLYTQSMEIQRRGLGRADEVVSLLYEGSREGSEMWSAISQYFDDEDDSGFGGKNSNKLKGAKNEMARRATAVGASSSSGARRELAFDEESWGHVVGLVQSGTIPAEDPLLIARFATGIISPRILKLKLSTNDKFGVAMRCDWQDVMFRSQQLVDQMKSK